MNFLDKVYNLTVDIRNIDNKYDSHAKFFDDDRETSVIKVRLLNNNSPINLEGCIVEAYFILANNSYHSESCKITNSNEGEIELELCQKCLVAGENTVRISISKENEIVNTPIITYKVRKGLYSDDPNFNNNPLTPILNQMLLDVKVVQVNQEELQKKYEQAFPQIEAKINEANDVIKRVNDAIASGTQDLEVKEARDGEATLKARLDRDIEKAKQVYVNVEGSNISTDSSSGYLKDVEILGNTIQDENNLADIKSVGDKLEGQELYKIPVLSCGKNLFDGDTITIKSKSWNDTLVQLDTILYKNIPINMYENIIVSMKCSNDTVKPKVIAHYSLLGESATSHGDAYSLVSKEGATEYGLGYSIPRKYNYVTITTGGYYPINSISPNVDIKFYDIQLEEGTVATPYEPYQEDKLTILSPTPLEKVGDVADRIICKDGVWGVEKKFLKEKLNDIEVVIYGVIGNGKGVLFKVKNILYNWTHTNYIIEGFKTVKLSTDATSYTTYCTSDSIAICLPSDFDSQQKCVDYLKGKTLIAEMINPTFIPLPHDQQIKLRTFANKTNISFLTEIEGTIKAQVPKSLGATVNTHTTQISNLNKELDRVKKLEESTVSTVETESDFTTVEATSNGYFEDVKLEGKTLIASNYIEKTTMYARFKVKPNTDYTYVMTGLETTYFGVFDKLISGTPIKHYERGQINVFNSGNNDEVVIHKSDDYEADNLGGSFLIEGDHTQNPPSYFEGLKSVGQDVDEIVVSSVKGDGNLFDGEIYKDSNKYWFIIRNIKNNSIYIDLGQTCSYFELYECGELSDCYIKYKDWKVIKTVSNQQTTITTVNKNHLIIAFNTNFFTSSEKLNKVIVNKGDAITSCKEYQADKKRLLFYNEETQTWEKPILREWDSIEKHSDGKYYYHQRSGEVVFDGNEDGIVLLGDNTTSTLGFGINKSNFPNIKKISVYPNENKVFNDRFNYLGGTLWNVDSVGIALNADDDSKMFQVKLLKTSLNTQDVAGFKQWLQTNNMTAVYELAEEKVYECTNIDLITYANETNYIVECGAISPKTTLKVHNNISNVVSLLQKKVSLLESNITKYMITQNRMQLASTYSADSVTFKVDYFSLCGDEENYDEDLYNLILNNILVGKDNYNYDKMFTIILDYASWNQISWEQFDILVGLMDIQHNPPVEDEIVEEIPNEIM